MTTMLPPYGSRNARDISDCVRGALPPVANLDWMPITGVDAVDALRPLHRQAVLKLEKAIVDLPGALVAVDGQMAEHAARLRGYNRACALAVKRGEMVPPRVEPANLADALTAVWSPIRQCFAEIDGAVRRILAEIQRHADDLDRRHIIPARLRGEVYFGQSGGPRTTPVLLIEGARDGSFINELTHLDGIVTACRAVLDPPPSTDAQLAA